MGRSNIFFLLLFVPFLVLAQYTDVINSNRPGLSVSAYAVGKNVIQAEFGALYEQRDHSLLNTTSDIIGADLSLRYGLLFEQLELNYEGTFISQNVNFTNFGTQERRTDFTRNRIGLKYLVYDKYKNPKNNKPNIYSWRANNVFQLKNLIPSAISLYGGATFNLGDNPFYPEIPILSYRGMIATQSKLTPRFVMITNFAYDRMFFSTGFSYRWDFHKDALIPVDKQPKEKIKRNAMKGKRKKTKKKKGKKKSEFDF